MSTLNVSRSFAVESPPDRVWDYLVHPELVVRCLPGAALHESSEDGRLHEGSVTIKVGPLGVSYRGSAEFTEVDADARRLRVKGKGREKTGAGAVSMDLLLEVPATEAGCEVRIDATIQLAGKIVTFGRGMIDVVTEEVLTSFSECLRRTLAVEGAGDEAAAGSRSDGTPARPGTISTGADRPGVGLGFLVRALWHRLRRLFRKS
jgi:uncharacterized protein